MDTKTKVFIGILLLGILLVIILVPLHVKGLLRAQKTDDQILDEWIVKKSEGKAALKDVKLMAKNLANGDAAVEKRIMDALLSAAKGDQYSDKNLNDIIGDVLSQNIKTAPSAP